MENINKFGVDYINNPQEKEFDKYIESVDEPYQVKHLFEILYTLYFLGLTFISRICSATIKR